MNIFYCTDLSGHSVILGEEDSKHAVKVLRLKSGDRIELVDGKGVRANGEIDDAHPKKCSVIITDRKKESSGRTYSLHIAIAPTKNSDRTEWFVEKAVEIGIDQITLLDCAHSERKRMNTDRLEKVAIAAMKQSEQSRLPHINAMVPVKKFLDELPKKGQRYIAHCRDGEKIMLKNDLNTVGDIVIMIGPEGDFSKDEILAAMFTGFKEISFGDTRLRTETAALMAVMSVKVLS
ncbi:MAG TPA: 16S rRNA (uracil(1498)-N(3))-methyltransferase [Bacteroidia bacterium]|jgi:16S rRNA (uracil1498-N3)-methyltransferase|nr:16S rRNA (uracil(1498)-N(3))-methyltransferase [Bacteroidia bacterium]